MRVPLALAALALAAFAVLAFAAPARAGLPTSFTRLALTSSEQAQIASYVAEGKVATAERVRALVARPDLSADESAAALTGALSPLVFNDHRAAYLHEMLYGEASLASRGTVAVAVTRALAARADGIVSRHEGDLDQDPASLAELSRIFAFVDTDVANAGQPHGAAHDPSAGIGSAAYDDAAKALVTLIAAHPRWLRGEAPVPAAFAPTRAQLELAGYDMTNDTTTRRFDAADRMGILGPRRAALTETGVLVLDDGHTDTAQLEFIRKMLAPAGPRRGVEALTLFDVKTPLRAREAVVDGGPSSSAAENGMAWAPGRAVFAITHRAAEAAVKRGFDARADLHAQCREDFERTRPDPNSKAGSVASPDVAVSFTAEELEFDAPWTLDTALTRLLDGYDRSATLLSDTLGVLAAAEPAPTTSLALGAASQMPATSAAALTNLRFSSAGYVTSFTMGGHTYEFLRGSDGLTVRRDRQPITDAMFPPH